MEEGKEQTTDSAFGCEFVDVGERELCYMKEKRGDQSQREAPCRQTKISTRYDIAKIEVLPRKQRDLGMRDQPAMWWPHTEGQEVLVNE